MSEETRLTYTDKETDEVMIDLSKIAEQKQAQNIDLASNFLPKLPAEAYTALQHIEIIASPEDWQKITYQIARTLVNAQYEITHRQIMEQMKVDNLDEMESDDDILAAALKLTS
ncbi:hypothetical protein VB711_07405 [Cronbergia sp. UHCC 0137]|uniref:hypothetical protein n=1 Tax=Cronbergia sp. UHCC 0137 TaxID=3110239 RepID=UPI002B2117F0|nr:hypothetical protein [Cronbergia sp. UHCC 0137]MEA5617662.1 hypothetical protein [Cronbergia sp. UHCC 0137]